MADDLAYSLMCLRYFCGTQLPQDVVEESFIGFVKGSVVLGTVTTVERQHWLVLWYPSCYTTLSRGSMCADVYPSRPEFRGKRCVRFNSKHAALHYAFEEWTGPPPREGFEILRVA